MSEKRKRTILSSSEENSNDESNDRIEILSHELSYLGKKWINENAEAQFNRLCLNYIEERLKNTPKRKNK